ncbi:hypothetical protein [Neorhizobium sp. NCHU2750]|uniref:hypothetical protein n=1 Tax=Neorhizobium sp. NCHU2750 TaxID=1825976 RepID=UPI000E747C75|nr:hypothetical protein NCHU2750_14640 [Neorhizobium sp. NCHU2750]
MLSKFVNALRPSLVDIDGTGTYPDGLFAAALARQADLDASGSLRASYGQDYQVARKSNEPPRPHS